MHSLITSRSLPSISFFLFFKRLSINRLDETILFLFEKKQKFINKKRQKLQSGRGHGVDSEITLVKKHNLIYLNYT